MARCVTAARPASTPGCAAGAAPGVAGCLPRVQYSNPTFGCFPPARVVREGGREAQGLTPGFDGTGFFAAEARDVVLDAVRRMAGREER